MKSNLSAAISLALTTLSITGCGGGGDAGGTSSPPLQPAGIDIAAVGIYKATVTGGPRPIFQTLIVGPTGKGAVYYEDGFGSSRGFVDATLSGSGGIFAGSLTDFASTGVFNGTASGTYRAGSGINATVTYPGQTSTIPFTFDNYPTLATGPASAVGSWNSMDERGTAQTITIVGAQTGTFSIVFGAQCTVTGIFTFGDNANTLQLATISGMSSGGGCRFGNGPMTGLLLVKSPGTSNPSIIGHLARQDKTDGFMLQSFRCRDGSSRTSLPLFGC